MLLVAAVLVAAIRPALASSTPQQYELTSHAGQKPEQVEKDWSEALAKHAKKLDCAFQNYESGDYRGYKKFKTKVWEPAFTHDHEVVYQYWLAIPDRTSARYQQLHNIFNAWANLNNASIYMQYYLLSGKPEELDQARNKLSHVKSTLAALNKRRQKAKDMTLKNQNLHLHKYPLKSSSFWIKQYG